MAGAASEAGRPSPWVRARPARRAGARLNLTALFAWASLAALFLVSNLMLAAFGLNYETSGGAQWEKIAPSTYLAFLALIALFAERGNPVALIDDIVRRNKGVIVFLITWAMLFAYIFVFHGAPLTATFDSFLLPIALTLIFTRLPDGTLRRMTMFVHIVMAANALLGLVEFATAWRLTPLVAQGMELTSDYRSSALLGHPLNNAIIVSSYALMLMLGGGRDLKPGWRAAALLLQVVAMAAFGGRFATLLFLMFAAAIGFWHLLALLNGRRFSMASAAAASFIVPLLITCAILLVADGFLDKFIMRFISDEGSAESRVKMFDLIARIPPHELLIGADPQTVATLQRTEGIAFGIESFWIAFIAYYGILISVPFFIGLMAYLADMWRWARKGGFWPIFFFLVVCSTSASLSGKSTTFALFVAPFTLLMRPLPSRGTGRAAPC